MIKSMGKRVHRAIKGQGAILEDCLYIYLPLRPFYFLYFYLSLRCSFVAGTVFAGACQALWLVSRDSIARVHPTC